MGLDMYLDKYPRLGLTPDQIDSVQSFWEWEAYCAEHEDKKCTLAEWCGEYMARILPAEPIREILRQYYTTQYYAWDTEHKYPYQMLYEPVAYWRKANQIHNWFVENVQNGEDDCRCHDEVTEDKLLTLLNICLDVKRNCPMIDGEVCDGQTYKDGQWINIMKPGKVMQNAEYAADVLPSRSGFFFGGEDYDQYYMEDIDNTINQLTQILKETNFETEIIYYCSSW